MHLELSGKHVDEEGKFHPVPHAKYDATRLQEQIDCEHPCDELLWSGDKSGLFAKCSSCKLKSIIAYEVFDPDSPSQPKAKAKPEAKEVFVADACRHNGARGPRTRNGCRKRSVSCHAKSRGSLNSRPLEVTIDKDVRNHEGS